MWFLPYLIYNQVGKLANMLKQTNNGECNEEKVGDMVIENTCSVSVHIS